MEFDYVKLFQNDNIKFTYKIFIIKKKAKYNLKNVYYNFFPKTFSKYFHMKSKK